jgi:hypothetical protein
VILSSQALLRRRLARGLLNLAAGGVTLLPATAADAPTDEIQVYDTEMNNAGVFSLQLHNDYTPIGAKLRAQFVVPHAAERSFFHVVNFELDCNARYWGTDPHSGEIRQIIGERLGPVDLIVNLILDTSFQGLGSLDFAPASRVAYHFFRNSGSSALTLCRLRPPQQA